MLVLTRGISETIVINHDIKIVVMSIRHGKVRLGIEAPKNIEVHRGEIQLLRDKEKRDAVDRTGTD